MTLLISHNIGNSIPNSIGSGKSSVLDSIFVEWASDLIERGVLPLSFSCLEVSIEKESTTSIIESNIVIGIIHPVPLFAEMAAVAAIITTAPSNRIPRELLATPTTRTKALMNLAHTGP